MSDELMGPPNGADRPHLIEEVIRQAESRLSAQLTSALAADQRALLFAGFLAAAIVGLVGGATTLFIGESSDTFLGFLALSVAAGLLAAMYLAVRAARPVEFEFVGTEPRKWAKDLGACRDLIECLAEQAHHYDEMIHENHLCMKRNSRWLTRSINISFVSLLVGGGVFLAYFLGKLAAGLTPTLWFLIFMGTATGLYFAALVARD